MASLVCNFIREKRIRTSLSKAKLTRRFAEKMVTLGKKGNLHARRQAIAELRDPRAVAILFRDIAPQFSSRAGGYTRVVKLDRRSGDGAAMALLEWVGVSAVSKKRKKTAKGKEEDQGKAEAKEAANEEKEKS